MTDLYAPLDFPFKDSIPRANLLYQDNLDQHSTQLRNIRSVKARLGECGSPLWDMEQFCYGCATTSRKLRKRCNLKICPRCQKRLRKQRFEKYGAFLCTFERPVFLTLTLQGYWPLEFVDSAFDKLVYAWRQMSRWLKSSDTANMKSYLKVLEIKRYYTPNGLCYSFHYHIVYDGLLVSESDIRERWLKYAATDEPSRQVDIERAVSIQKTLHYLKKYVLKGNHLKEPEEELVFYKKQFVHSWGLYIPDLPDDFYKSSYTLYEEFLVYMCPVCHSVYYHDKLAGKPYASTPYEVGDKIT
jgi:hypothetical protein